MYAVVYCGLIAAATFFLGSMATLRFSAKVPTLPNSAFGVLLSAAMVGAALSAGEPSGSPVADVVWRVSFAAVCVCATRLVSRHVLMVVAIMALAAMVVRPSSLLALSLAAAGVGLVSCLYRPGRDRRESGGRASTEAQRRSAAPMYRQQSRSPIVALAAAGLVANALLRLPTGLPQRVPSAIAAAGVIVLAMAALGRCGRPLRRWILIGAGVFTVAAAISATATALQANSARREAQAGLTAARGALDAAKIADANGAAKQFHQAADALRSAQNTLDSSAAIIGRFLPIVGPNVRSAQALAINGAEVASSAADAVATVDFNQMRTPDARIDVQRLANLRQPVNRVQRSVDRALDAITGAQGTWIVPKLATQALSFQRQLEDAKQSTGNAKQLLDALPELLGLHGPRRYLLVVPSPAEARGSGGLIGNYGEITAVNGTVSLSHFGRTYELNDNGVPASQRVLKARADYIRRYSPFDVGRLWQNVTMSPDFASSAEAMASLYPQSGGSTIDGVISADPFALAALLRITGPVSVDGWPEPITADNAARVLLYDFYAQLSPDRNVERIDLQQQVAQLTWSRLFTGPIPSPQTLGSSLGAVAKARHLQLWATRPEEQRFLRHLGADGSMGPLADDGFAAVTNNAGANKIDWYLHRTVSYDASVDLDTGAIESVATVEMTNEAPSSGVADYLIANTAVPPAPPGTSVQYLSLYSPLELQAVSLDGKPFAIHADRELGRNVYSGWVRIAPGATATVVATFARTGKVNIGTYSVELGCQPLVNDDSADVRVRIKNPTTRDRISVNNLAGPAGDLVAQEPLTCGRVYSLARQP